MVERFLVTGATGFIGSHLVRRIRAHGDAVTVLVRSTSRPERRAELERLGVSGVEGDLATGAGLAEAVRGVNRVIHLAALVKARDPADYVRVNAEGTRRLMSAVAARPDPPRVVVCSSLTAAGPSPAPGAVGGGPVSHYGRSKLGAENAAREFADRVPVVIVRPPIVYGPGDTEFLPSLLPMARRGLMLQGGLRQKWYSLIHVHDLCSALVAAAERGRTVRAPGTLDGVYTVSDGDVHTTADICAALADVLGWPRLLVIPVPDAIVFLAAAGSELVGRVRGTVPVFSRDKAREMRCSDWTCTSDRAVAELGFHARIPLRRGLAELVGAHNGGAR
jgi:dihydroflavonol-4-reductase